MPELPEVECVRRGLQRAGLKSPLRKLWRSNLPLRTGKTWRQENLRVLRKTRPAAVERRGKFLVWTFEGADDRLRGLVVHLGMTGRLIVHAHTVPRARHTHLVLEFEDDREVHFVDARRFGGVRAGFLEQLLCAPPLCDLGIEPLTAAFGPGPLEAAGGSSRRTIRDVLLDQRVVAGIGNIYVSEILFRARVHPMAKAYRIRSSAWRRIADEARAVLSAAVTNGGTSLRDYRNADGEPGQNQNALAVYGRAELPCPDCGLELVGYVHAGRSGVYCPKHQPRPAGGWVR